jgi:hypothetical protein
MPRWVMRTVNRVRLFAAARNVSFTDKAATELSALGIDSEDAKDVLGRLSPREAACRVRSERSGAWLYVFKTRLEGTSLYVKLAFRQTCVVVSFHEDKEDSDAQREP